MKSIYVALIVRRQWHPTPVLLAGKSHGQRTLVGCSLWGHALGTWPWWAVWVTVPFFCLIEFCSAHTPQFVYKNPKTSSVSSPTWSSFLKTVLDFSGPLHLQIKFSISSWASTKMPVGFWLGLHRKPVSLGKENIPTILIPLWCEGEISLHLFGP